MRPRMSGLGHKATIYEPLGCVRYRVESGRGMSALMGSLELPCSVWYCLPRSGGH